MDCMDCHNRPSHNFLSPEKCVDRALAEGRLDASIPHLKEAAVGALAAEYSTRAAADAGIEAGLRAFYEKKGLDADAAVAPRLAALIGEIRRIHRQNFFPEMRASWAAYPDHRGHREFPGCFRCHNDRHRSADGKVLTKDCGLCHEFARRSDDGKALVALPADASFAHPWKHEKHSRLDCWECHTGKSSPYGACGKCHEFDPKAPMAFACSACHRPMKVAVEAGECVSCHDASKSKMHSRKGHEDCISCHKQHEWKTVDYPDDCTGSCHRDLKDPHYPDKPCAPCHDFKGVSSFLAGPGLNNRGSSGG
jgi:hypothetical protein